MPLTAIQVGAGWFSENPGGLDRYYHDLLAALPEAGVVCRGLVVGTSLVDEESDGSVRAFALPSDPIRTRWKNVRQSVARIWQTRPPPERCLLVTHFALYAYPLLKDNIGRPLVVHFHGPWAAESLAENGRGLVAWIKKRIELSVYRKADRIIVLSEAFGELLTQTYRVPAGKVTVIPGGVDMDRFAVASVTPRAAARKQCGWPIDRPIVLCVRRLTNRMGLEALVEAMKQVRLTVPNALCMIAGRGPLAETLVAQIHAAGLADTVTLLGFVPDEDLPLAYRAADVSVMPSETLEGFGLSAAESLAAGTPVLVNPVGGLPEVVRGLDPKLVLSGTTAATLAGPLITALTVPSTLPTPEQCHAYAAANFDWTVIAGRIAEVYASAMK